MFCKFYLKLYASRQTCDWCCRDKGPKNICWALGLVEEAQWSGDRLTIRKMWDFELHELAMIVKVGEDRPRRSISSAKRRRSQKVCSVIQSDVSGSSVDKDIHSEHTGQMRADKYLRENYYYRIKYSVTNFLVALVRK